MKQLPGFASRKRFVITALVCFFALGLPTAFVIGRGHLLTTIAKAKAAAALKAYTITTEERLACYPAGDEVRAKVFNLVTKTVRAVRGDGAVVEEIQEPQFNTVHREIRLAPNNKIMALDSVRKKFSIVRPGDSTTVALDPNANCMVGFDGGRVHRDGARLDGFETIGGLNTVRLKLADNEKEKITFWFALDYGCAVVKHDSWYYTSDPLKSPGVVSISHGVLNLVSVKDGEPDPALFDTSQLAETKPSDALIEHGKAWRARTGMTMTPNELERMKKNNAAHDALWESQHGTGKK